MLPKKASFPLYAAAVVFLTMGTVEFNGTPQVDPFGCVWKLRSGIYWSSAFAVGYIDRDTLLVSCRHSIEHSREDLEVILPDGYRIKAKLHSVHPSADLALVRIEGRWPLIEISRKPLAVGDRVTTAGFPLGRTLSINDGRFNGENRISANVDRGASGGPVLDKDGRAVGVIQSVQWKWVGMLQVSVPWMGQFVSVVAVEEML